MGRVLSVPRCIFDKAAHLELAHLDLQVAAHFAHLVEEIYRHRPDRGQENRRRDSRRDRALISEVLRAEEALRQAGRTRRRHFCAGYS